MLYEFNKYYNANLYASITKGVKNQQLFMNPICGYCIFEIALWKL